MSHRPVTFDQLPTLVVELTEKVDNLTTKLQLLAETGAITHTGEEPALDVDQAASVLGISKQTIYQNTDKIPHRKRFGRLYFFRSELLDYLKGGVSL